jgi:hypothetical protein
MWPLGLLFKKLKFYAEDQHKITKYNDKKNPKFSKARVHRYDPVLIIIIYQVTTMSELF